MIRLIRAAAICTLLALASPGQAEEGAANGDQTFTGTLTRADHGAYREIPFSVPEGAARVTIEISYERGDPWAAIDMAVHDPQRFRGASLFSRTRIDIGEDDASPAYIAGPLPAGAWTLVLGGANAPEGRETPYAVRIHIDARGAEPPALAGVVRNEPGWYRGDFHTHTGYSDGACASRAGVRAPCPVYRTLEAAAERGLDFIAVTDHNTISHLQALRELQPHFDTLAIIAGQEVTTYQGHMNVFGLTAPIDFRLGTPAAANVEAIAAQVAAQSGLLSINHPGISLTQGCPGCGWSAEVADYAGVNAIEVVNGVVARWGDGPEGPASSIPFWIARLNEGRRIAAIGGSDNHDATERGELSAIGAPTTVVYAASLSATDLLAGVRAGHVFVDIEGTRDRLLTLSARTRGAEAAMGDALTARRGANVSFEAAARAAPEGARLEIWLDGAPLDTGADDTPLLPDEARRFTWRSDGARHWVSANVRSAEGRLLLIGNPIYLNAR